MIPVKTKIIGVITEDKSDFDTLNAIITRLPCQSHIKLKKACAKGCTRITTKCRRMAMDLKNKNCERLIIVRDLDTYDEKAIKTAIQKAISPSPIDNYIIIIPTRAIEAWLLSDMKAIQKVFNYNQTQIKDIPNTETIADPKDHLSNFVKIRLKKQYLNTVHNAKIANFIDLSKVLKCQSFKPLYSYVTTCK